MVIKIYAAAELEIVLVNLLKVMTVFRFYANEALSHALTCLRKRKNTSNGQKTLRKRLLRGLNLDVCSSTI